MMFFLFGFSLIIVWILQIRSKIREIQTKDWSNPDKKLAKSKQKICFFIV
jgi:hypothetical protein